MAVMQWEMWTASGAVHPVKGGRSVCRIRPDGKGRREPEELDHGRDRR